jgi:hypothetical protein
MAKPVDLFQAYKAGKLPMDGGGFIMSIFYDNARGSMYTIYEIVTYNSVKDIRFSGEGLWFKSDMYKVFVLLEPLSFNEKFKDPIHRGQGMSIPYKFSECQVFNMKNNSKVIIGKEAQFSFSSFTVVEPDGDDLSVFFFPIESVYDDIQSFLLTTLRNDIAADSYDAKKVARFIVDALKKIVFKSYTDTEKG